MAAKAFLEKYMDCMDAMPHDIQCLVSQYYELDIESKELIEKARSIRSEGDGILAGGPGSSRQWMIKFQRTMLALREIGDRKVDLTSKMLDMAEGYSQQLSLAEKDMDNCRTRDELTGTRSSGAATAHKNSFQVTDFVEKKKAERSQKRTRNTTGDRMEEDTSGSSTTSATKEPKKENTAVSATTPTQPMKPTKKKIKVKKKTSSTGAKEATTPTVSTLEILPRPDFTSEPIDPDEPVYCLCSQVSFGEMIGCDNEECPIEWFHFQCVGLTSKPKGKWYCPQCSSERTKYKSSK